jgi:uncharacterized BrkB/YihY/UPF0761 family membrane protein
MAIRAVRETDMSLRCAGVAFYGLMSFFPTLAQAGG